jgi:hypothetical protein
MNARHAAGKGKTDHAGGPLAHARSYGSEQIRSLTLVVTGLRSDRASFCLLR